MSLSAEETIPPELQPDVNARSKQYVMPRMSDPHWWWSTAIFRT